MKKFRCKYIGGAFKAMKNKIVYAQQHKEDTQYRQDLWRFRYKNEKDSYICSQDCLKFL